MLPAKNELYLEMLSVCGTNPFHQHTSSPRSHMLSSHLGQALEILGASERGIQTGIERELAKTTFSVKMPVDGEILEIIERYPSTMGHNSVASNPQTIVFYQDVNTKEIGIISLLDYCSNHQYFGFRYKHGEGMNFLYIGAKIGKGTIFLDSASVTEDGGYMYGVEANLALMTHPATSEDGVLVSSEFLEKLKFRTYESRVVEWGKNKFPLNLYGDVNNYKTFPDIGEEVRDDGILMALRSYDPSDLAPVEQSIYDTMKVDYTFDSRTYANGPGGKIIDIRIQHDVNDSNHVQPTIDAQTLKYDTLRRKFYQRIFDFYNGLRRRWGHTLQITPDMQALIVSAAAVMQETDPNSKQKINKVYRQAPLDCYRVEFIIEYEIKPNIGFKVTGCHGNKGVICQMVPADEMPVDQDGNRADICMDPRSIVARANPGISYEQYYNATTRDAHKTVCRMLGVYNESKEFRNLDYATPNVINDAWRYLVNLYQIVSPHLYDKAITITDIDGIKDWLTTVVQTNILLLIPPDSQPENTVVVNTIQNLAQYRPVYGPVSYVGNSGRRVTTKFNVRIGSIYLMLLEKTGDDWSAVSSGRLNHFGVLAPLTKMDKYSNPARLQAVRGTAEAEARNYSSNCGPEFLAELKDRNDNPGTHKIVVNGLLSAACPTNINNLVDRYKHPFGGAKPHMLVKHILLCSGMEFKYTPYISNWDLTGVVQ